jgi:PAS domain S-box-containing protein
MEDKNKIKEVSAIYETIFDNAPDGILLADVENKNFYIGNKMICQMLGYSLEEIKNMGIRDIHAKEDLPYVIEQFEKQSRKEIVTAKDIPVKRKDGSIFYADVNSVSITLSGKPYVAGIFRDITERKKAEALMKLRYDLVEYAGTHSLEELLQKTLDEIGALTNSPIGFYYFVEVDQKTLSLQA